MEIKSDRQTSIAKPVVHAANGASATGKTRVSSRIQGFAKMSPKERLHALVASGFIEEEDVAVFLNSGALPSQHAESFIENCVGGFTLPFGVASNFRIDGEEYFIPMAVEESSVVAAASHGAKLARSGGGFFTELTRTIATSQVQFFSQLSRSETQAAFETNRPAIFARANQCHPRLVERGGGVVSIELRHLREDCFVLHIHVDTKEAMGANIVNTIAEEIGKHLHEWIPCRVGLKILTNLCVHRLSQVTCEVLASALQMEGFTGEEAIERMIQAYEFAAMDPFRAATHNKGVMNGIDPVVIATGNDWRAVEAGCHAFAALQGTYRPMTRWWRNERGNLQGELVAPIAVGTVGGVTKLHPAARSALRLLGNPPADELSSIIACVGLAQNLSALRALACEGIQKGHMALHEKNIEMLRKYDHIPQIQAIEETKPSS